MSASGERMIGAAPGSHNYVVHAVREKDKMCKDIIVEETKLPKDAVFFGHGNI